MIKHILYKFLRSIFIGLSGSITVIVSIFYLKPDVDYWVKGLYFCSGLFAMVYAGLKLFDKNLDN